MGQLLIDQHIYEGVWWTGDEDLDWVAEYYDTGADGIFGTNDMVKWMAYQQMEKQILIKLILMNQIKLD